MKNVAVDHFWTFLDLLDVPNRSGSKFYAGKCYQELWRAKTIHFAHRLVEVTRMIELKVGTTISRDSIIKWDPEVGLGCFLYES